MSCVFASLVHELVRGYNIISDDEVHVDMMLQDLMWRKVVQYGAKLMRNDIAM